jgi:hypothetical protein
MPTATIAVASPTALSATTNWHLPTLTAPSSSTRTSSWCSSFAATSIWRKGASTRRAPTTALEIAPYDARTYADRGDLGEQAGDTAGAIRDYRIAQLLNPNLYAPEDRLPVLAPEQTAPDLGPLTYKPPQEGLRISFIQVVNDVTAVSEEEEFLAELVYWFTGPPEKPRPISRVFMQRDIGATGDNVTPVAAVELFTNNEPTTVHYDHLLLPLEVPEAGTAFTYAGTDAIWQLGPGESTNGTGELLLSCPPEPDPMAAVLGCTAGVANIAVGTIQWDATFVGWEYVLVPVGYRVAARIDYNDTMETQLFGQAVTRTSQTTFWFDPEIHWWIKRERTEGDQIQTVEAVTIETP